MPWRASQEGVSPVPTNSSETADAPHLRRSQSPSDIVTSATAFQRLHMPRLCLLVMENVLALPCQGPLGTTNEEEPPSADGSTLASDRGNWRRQQWQGQARRSRARDAAHQPNWQRWLLILQAPGSRPTSPTQGQVLEEATCQAIRVGQQFDFVPMSLTSLFHSYLFQERRMLQLLRIKSTKWECNICPMGHSSASFNSRKGV